MDTGGPMDGLTADQCPAYAPRSDGSLGQRRGKWPLPRCWLRATKDQFAGFLRWSARAPRAATPPRRRAHREMRIASCPTPGSGEGIVMTKTSTLEGGLEWTSGTGHCAARPMSQMGHVWTAPAVQEESDYQRSVRVQSCIRPLSAAVLTAGPDVIR